MPCSLANHDNCCQVFALCLALCKAFDLQGVTESLQQCCVAGALPTKRVCEHQGGGAQMSQGGIHADLVPVALGRQGCRLGVAVP